MNIAQIDRISKGLGCKTASPYWFGVDTGYLGQIGTPEQREVRMVVDYSIV